MIQGRERDYFWNTLGVLLQNALSPLLIVIVTRMHGLEDSGVFSFALSLAIIFWALAMWGGRTYQVSDAKKTFEVQSYILLRVVLGVVILGLAISFCLINGYDLTKTSIILSLVIVKIIESVADAIYGVLQVNKHLYVAGISLMYKSIGGFIAFIAIGLLTKSVLLSCLGLAAVNGVFVLFYDIPRASRLQGIRIEGSLLRKYLHQVLAILKKTAALCAVSFLAALSLNIPRYFLDASHPSQIGYFGIMAMPVTLVVLLVTFILQPSIVAMSEWFRDHKYADFSVVVKKILSSTFLIGAVTVAVTYLLGVPVLNFIFGQDFSQYKEALIIITAGGVASAYVAVFITILTVMRELSAQVCVLLITNGLLLLGYLLYAKNAEIIISVSLFAITAACQAIAFGHIYRNRMRKAYHENN